MVRLAGGREGRALPAANEPTEVALGRVDLVRDLESARKAGSAKLATALSALENLRIDLLRVSAGQAAGPGITGHIEAARRIGREVDARIGVE
jgi:uncharacterized protein (UPF0212 family)